MANTISDELNRLIQAKAGIKSALEEKGLTIGDSSTLDEFPGLIQEMQTGGGGSSADTSVLIDMIEENNVQRVIIPKSITKLKGQFYNDAYRLKDVIFHENFTSLGDNVFSSNGTMSKKWDNGGGSITFLSYNPPKTSNFTFYNFRSRIFKKHDASQGYYWGAYLDIHDLASMTYDSSTYTVTASGRDNLELYVDASFINSSIYTFDSTTQTGNHTVTVKSVDPSLGVLDEVSQEITI